ILETDQLEISPAQAFDSSIRWSLLAELPGIPAHLTRPGSSPDSLRLSCAPFSMTCKARPIGWGASSCHPTAACLNPPKSPRNPGAAIHGYTRLYTAIHGSHSRTAPGTGT